MTIRAGALRLATLTLTFAVAACGSANGDQASGGSAGASPSREWTSTMDGDDLRLHRKLDRLTLSYTLSPGREGPQATILAEASPCLGGKGKQLADDRYTADYFDDASAISDIRDRFDGVVGRINDLCDVPQETIDEIQSGFDGLYFRSASDRAAFADQ